MQEKILQQVPAAEENLSKFPSTESQTRDSEVTQRLKEGRQFTVSTIHYAEDANTTDKQSVTAPPVNIQYNHNIDHTIGYRHSLNNGYHHIPQISSVDNEQSQVENISNNTTSAAKNHQQTLLLSQPVGNWQDKTTVDSLNNVKIKYESHNMASTNPEQTRPLDNQAQLCIPPVTSILRPHGPPINPPPHQQQQYIPNHMFAMPSYCHLPEQQRVSSPQNMTYLTPSRSSPVVSAFQTPQWQTTRNLKPKRISSPSDGDTDKSCDEEEIDVVNEPLGNSRSVDTSKDSDISMTSNQSTKSNSPSGSSTGSPGSSTTSPNLDEGIKKKARTNYSPSQVQALEKVFHENPYPDAEKMEALSKELEIPEGKIKVWFQNKRARWRRRAQDNSHLPPYMAHLSPVLSPVASYGFMGHMMGASPPAQVVPGHFMFAGTPGSPVSSTHQNQTMPSPYQSRGQLGPYFPMYPYGMIPPYYCSS